MYRPTRKELKDVLPKKADFRPFGEDAFEAAKPGGKASLTGKELGIPSLEKEKSFLTDFSDKEDIADSDSGVFQDILRLNGLNFRDAG